MKTGVASHVLRGHEGSVLTVQWSPKDEFQLASGGTDRRALIWDVRRVKSVLMSLDMDRGRGDTRFRYRFRFNVAQACGTALESLINLPILLIWFTSTRFNVPSSSSSSPTSSRAHEGSVKCVHFTSDGHHLLSYGGDGQLRLWDSSSSSSSPGKLRRTHYPKLETLPCGDRNSDRKSSLAISDAGLGSAVFCPDENEIRVFDLFTGIDLLAEDSLTVTDDASVRAA